VLPQDFFRYQHPLLLREAGVYLFNLLIVFDLLPLRGQLVHQVSPYYLQYLLLLLLSGAH